VSEHETWQVKGLSADAEILIDRWGIPHLRASNLDDLFFLQGFNAARDRLWQIDLWRKRGLGLLAADFGPGYLAQDYASRLFLYHGNMQAEWDAYCPDAEQICTSFVNGINCYIEQTEKDPALLPPEFTLMGTKPSRWKAEDVARIRSHGLCRNVLSELLRARILTEADQATDEIRRPLEPEHVPGHIPGLDLGSIPIDIATLFKLGIAGVTFSEARLNAKLEEAWNWTKITDLGEVIEEISATGSNNWVVSGERSTTGRPILANDPHRAHGLPGLRYLVHLTAPGFDAIGAGEPVIPGISIGHNGTSAFGLTIFYTDQEDLYVLDTDPDNALNYRWQGEWRAMRIVNETFRVRNAPDQILTQHFSHHGPILLQEKVHNRAYAVRSVWFEPGAAPYLKSIASMRTTTLTDFREAIRGWGVPSVNLVYADTSGDTAWAPVGFAPIRKNWDGLLPVPGDGTYEWQGLLDNEALPRVVRPAKGFFATANEMNLPDNYPHPIGYEWVDRARADRINEVLSGKQKISLDDCCALQNDPVSIPARRLAHLAQQACPDGPAVGLLQNWGGALEKDSAAAALVEIWWTQHLRPALLCQLVPDENVRLLVGAGDIESLLRALEHPDQRLGTKPVKARNILLAETLKDAFLDCQTRLGDDPAEWHWGDIHHAAFEHGISSVAKAAEAWTVGPFPHGGSGSSPMHTGYRASDFRTTQGASVRMVMDVGDWDASLWINAPGQSGDPRSLHFANLAPIWAKGDYVPMLYSLKSIKEHVIKHISLVLEH